MRGYNSQIVYDKSGKFYLADCLEGQDIERKVRLFTE